MIAELRKQLETEAAEEEDNVQASIKLSLLFPKIFQKTKQEEEKTAMYGKVVLSFIFVLLLVFSYSILPLCSVLFSLVQFQLFPFSVLGEDCPQIPEAIQTCYIRKTQIYGS